VAELIRLAHSNELDGIVVSPASRESRSANPNAAVSLQKTAEARKLIGGAWWKSFSRLIEPTDSGEGNGARSRKEKGAAPVEQESHANEEGVKVA
jgi:hypothetical protein